MWRLQQDFPMASGREGDLQGRSCCPQPAKYVSALHSSWTDGFSERAVIKPTNPPPTSPALSDTDHEGEQDASNPASKSTTFPLDPATDQSGYAEASSQLNFDPDNIIPGPYEINTVCDDEPPKTEPHVEKVGQLQTEDNPENIIIPELLIHNSLPNQDFPCYSANFDMPDDWLGVVRDQGQDLEFPEMQFMDNLDVSVEEALQPRTRPRRWLLGHPSPSPSVSSSSTGDCQRDYSLRLKEPALPPDSPEILVSMFSRLTCGILSIKDGPSENPWRTKLLPMSIDVPALRHAILSMTAFHASREDPRYRVAGLRHGQKSIQYLGNRLNIMRKDAALATTLVLAFSESWDQEISTGIRHLRAARKLVNQAIAHHPHNADFDELDRLKFLRNTWVYMDVIARLTALDTEEIENLDNFFSPVYGPDGLVEDLDPLMGCASSFFPLLGRVANLVREIRTTGRISPRAMSKAASLRIEIWKWRPPSHLRQPEDESIEIGHSIKTAEAYRWATLLLLYQAVPMIATETLGDLAERILYDLVIVPTSSRLVIVHIFPLMVAGCEMVTEDNRLLVEERWQSMTKRMTIGNLDRCLDVIHEVWRRRDDHARRRCEADDLTMVSDEDIEIIPGLGKRRRTFSSPKSRQGIVRPDQLRRTSADHVADIDPETSIRGKCHWLTVMADWNWASKSSLCWHPFFQFDHLQFS